MQVPSTALLRAFSPWLSLNNATKPLQKCLAQQQLTHQRADFSSTSQKQAKKNRQQPKKDTRITLIRYFLQHPLTPRPLRFSRTRFLRHWTIHRAWQLHQSKVRAKRQLEYMQQYQSMANACEALRNIDSQGMTAAERSNLGLEEAAGSSIGKLYRIAMEKRRVWEGIPIEYARIQTDTPPRDGWNHSWTR